MNIHFNSLSNLVITSFNQSVQPSLSGPQKKIMIIAALAATVLLGILSFFGLNRHGWSMKNWPVNGQGQGRKTFFNGDVWEGEFKDGSLNGPGKKISNRQILFGKGTIFEVLGRGTIREGKFNNSLLNGPGKITHFDGTIEEGEFAKDYLIKGKQIHPNGIIDEGEFEMGAHCGGWMHGQGKRIYLSGEIEEGEFIHGRLDGKGKITCPDGTIYEGNHLRGMSSSVQIDKKLCICGQGRITLPSGIVLEGKIRGRTLHGQGKEISPNGTVEKEGIFEEGVLTQSNLQIHDVV